MRKKDQLAVNRDKPDRWKADIGRSVDRFNMWFMEFAPKAFRETRLATTRQVEAALRWTENLTKLTPALLREQPGVVPILRMATCPPIARDRLIGLSAASKGLVGHMEKKNAIPPKMHADTFEKEAQKIIATIQKLVDPDIFVWLSRKGKPSGAEIGRAATIVADRLCGSIADPIVRNAQEARQLSVIAKWLGKRGYTPVAKGLKFGGMEPGTYGFHMNVPVKIEGMDRPVNIPIDVVVMPRKFQKGKLPLFIEAKSAGDFTNVNKRRKEETTKMIQLRKNYGQGVQFVLFLCGYFDTGYLGYEAAEGIDWVWEHRIDDLSEFGI
jgi:XamI restriction endonuclease